MKTVKANISYRGKASRSELFIRLVYAIPIVVVLGIFEMVVGLAMFIQWFHILLLAKRHKSLSEIIEKYIVYKVQIYSYLFLATDERPPIIPEGF